MKELGGTRSAHHADHLLHTPDTFMSAHRSARHEERAPPSFTSLRARGAGFTQYTAEFSAGGELGVCAQSRFLYVLEGALNVGEHMLEANGYAYLPPGHVSKVYSAESARASVIEKEYVPCGSPGIYRSCPLHRH